MSKPPNLSRQMYFRRIGSFSFGKLGDPEGYQERQIRNLDWGGRASCRRYRLLRHGDKSGHPDARISARSNCLVHSLWTALLLYCLRNSEGEEMGLHRGISSLHHFSGSRRATDSCPTLGTDVRSGILCSAGFHNRKHDCNLCSSVQLLFASNRNYSQARSKQLALH